MKKAPCSVSQTPWNRSSSGFESFEESCRSTEFYRGQELLGRAWASGQPIWVSDLAHDGSPHTTAAATAGFRSCFALPIRMMEAVFGVIELFSREHVSPDPDLLGVLGMAATAIGQVIERKRAESVRARLAAILDAATDFVGLVLEPAGTILSVSRAVEGIFGFSPLAIVGQPLTTLIPEYRRNLQEQGCPDDLSAPGFPACSLRMRGRTRSGTMIPLEISLAEYGENESRVIAGVARDITNRTVSEEMLDRQAEDLRCSEQALRHQTRLVNSIVTSMADSVIAADENGEIVLYNPAAADLLGEQVVSSIPDLDTLAGLGYSLFLSDRQTPCPADQLPLLRAVRGETVDGLELFIKTPCVPTAFG
jgi:PAS domain S-box-containing protein